MITKLDMINPHVWLRLDVRNDAGKTDTWDVESFSLNNFVREGWKEKLKPGTTTTASGFSKPATPAPAR